MISKISVVIPCYNEGENINTTYERISSNVSKISEHYELIFVDDGSIDNSFSKLYSLSKTDKKLKIIKLSRNFGHQNAIFAGLENSSGVIVADPADIINMSLGGGGSSNTMQRNPRPDTRRRSYQSLQHSSGATLR
mgnify:CR=1 FL=1